MKKVIGVVCFFVLAFGGYAHAGKGHDTQPYAGSAEFERLKALAGTWVGSSEMDGQKQSVTIEYKVTSNGSALVETLMPGTPMEMVSVYNEENGKLVMTHYCALGNQPKLELKKSNDGQYEFELAKRSAINAKKDLHMHALVVTMPEPDKLVQSWVSYENGKPQPPHVFTYARISEE